MRLHSFLFCLFPLMGMAQLSSPAPSPVNNRLSPGTALFLQQPNDRFLFPRLYDGRVSALIQTQDAFDRQVEGVEISGTYGNVHSVLCTEQGVLNLTQEAGVTYIDLAFRLNRLKYNNDTTRILSKVNQVHQGLSNNLPDNFLGTNVVVGIVDVGFMPENPSFYNADGSAYRVKRWWHQSNGSGQKPTGYSYGTEFSAVSDILAARDDDGTHGTHVAGIAAGSGLSTPGLKYRGMAPDADLVFVTIKYANDTLAGSALGDYIVANPTILDAYKYVFDYASSQQKAAVCNLSWGMHTGPHDGNSLFDRAVEALTGKGKIIVGAGGNDGEHQMHISKDLQSDTAYTFAIDRSRNDYKRENIYVDAWGAANSLFGVNVTLVDTNGNILVNSPFYYSNGNSLYKKVFSNGVDTFWFTLGVNPSFVNNSKPELLIMVETNNASKQRIRLGFTGNGTFHAWNSGQTYRWTSGSFLDAVKGNNKAGNYLNGTVENSIGENGGSGKSTITAGSYVARNSWTSYDTVYRAQGWLNVGEISGFSSRGPMADGRIKPDIAAPGQLIASCVNTRTYPGWMKDITTSKTSFKGQDYYWVLFSGTSMASPHVCGIVALMLQLNPNLTPTDVRTILQKTATRDAFTGPDSNIRYGYGKINAYEAMKATQALTIQSNEFSDVQCFPNPAQEMTHFYIPGQRNAPVNVVLTNNAGRTILSKMLFADEMGFCGLDLQDMSAGVYYWSIGLGEKSFTGTLLISN